MANKKKGSGGSGKRPFVVKDYTSKGWYSRSASALANALKGKGFAKYKKKA